MYLYSSSMGYAGQRDFLILEYLITVNMMPLGFSLQELKESSQVAPPVVAGRHFNGFTSQEIESAISLVKKTYNKDLDVDCKSNENKNIRYWDSFSQELQNLPSDSKSRQNASKSEKTNNSEETDDQSFDVGVKKNGTCLISTVKKHKRDSVSRHTAIKQNVAKKLLKKAKQTSCQNKVSEVLQSEKGNLSVSRKFVLPSRSAHSSRVIKPNKRFIETEEVLSDISARTSKIPLKSSLHSDTSRSIQSSSKDTTRSTDSSIVCDDESCDSDKLTEYDPSKKPLDPSLWSCSSGGKVILRKARLKLKSPVAKSIVDGPFSATTSRPSSASSSTPGTVICGVCGAVRFYRFVKQARKFKILCCESCRKFISKIMRRQTEAMPPLGCQRGDGKCTVPPILRSQQWRATNTKMSCGYKARCPACWLKMCLQAFQMPENLHKKLTRMLPSFMRKPPFTYIKQEKTSTASPQEESEETTGSSPNHFIKLEPFHDEEMNDKRHKRKAALDSFIKITPNRQVEEKKKKKRVDAIGSHKQKRLTHIRTSKILKKAAKNLSKSKEDKFSSRSLKKKAKEKNKKVNGSKVRKKASSLSGMLDDSVGSARS
uniref:Nuclear receptor domain-containing protein n=1 Tax=Timema cristinae TaxID=61476 RepID=A0A7R9GXP2_TIMCR|nr:unnamed protein product [Timema cristinae]